MHIFLIVTALYFLAVMSPGPDFIMVTRNTLLYSRQAAILTAIGISMGVMIHATYSMFGLAFLANSYQNIIPLIQYAGGAYLIYIGANSFFSGHIQQQKSQIFSQHISQFEAFMNGFFCNVFNPKACLFFISFFTVLIQYQVPLYLQFLYAIEVVVLTLLWFTGVAIFFTIPSINQKLALVQHILMKIFGVLLCGLGFYLLILNVLPA